ncbi:MAG TPA: hypothetical protein VHM31_03005 [Polyangia bacterium]|nr:hypothetical protein [Polyangia bacterium]
MTRQAYAGTRPRIAYLAVLSAAGLLACASPASNNTGTGGSSATGGNGSGNGGSNARGGSTGSGGSNNTGSGGSNNTGSGGSNNTGTGGSNTGTGGSVTTGTGGSNTTGTGGTHTGGTTGSGGSNTTGAGGSATGGAAGSGPGGSSGCSNSDMNTINEDASGYVCNNKWGIQGAWYCYSDGSDSGNSCKGSDGKGTGAIPWNSSSNAMCLSGTMGTGSGKYAGIGFKVNSGKPGSTAAPGTWDASKIVGFAITLTSGASSKGSGGMVLNLEYPTSSNLDPQTQDAPGVTLPGVGSTEKTYNVLFSDAVLANNKNHSTSVDPTKLTDVKLAFFPDSVTHAYDFCIKSIVPLATAPSPVVATGAYGPTWNNQLPQAVNGVNGYAVQSAPFPTNGNPMTMQVTATATGVGFSYMAGGGFQAPNNGPGSFPAIISGWGPGHDGIQFYGPYKGGKKISQLQTVKSNWSFTMGSTGDAVYDVWFSNASTQPPAVPGIELMIWIGNTGKMPLGSVASPGTPVSGRTPYVGTNGTGEQVVSYWVAAPGTTSVSNFDLLPYFQDAASHGYAGLKNDSVLLGIQTGFEVYSGNWTTTDYNITIQ